MQFFIILALFITLGIVLFAFQNMADVTLKFLGWEFIWPLSFMLSITFVSGLLTGLLISLSSILKKSRQRRSDRKRLAELEKKLARISEERREEGQAEG